MGFNYMNNVINAGGDHQKNKDSEVDFGQGLHFGLQELLFNFRLLDFHGNLFIFFVEWLLSYSASL